MTLFDTVKRLMRRTNASPYSEAGVGGAAIYGGYIKTIDAKSLLQGGRRWRTAQEILTDISIVAASVRYFLNLTARPLWKCEPVDDTAPARAAAEFMESVIYDIDTSWSRIVRRSGMFKFHGFGIHEWVAKKRDDGRIGIDSVEPRPQHTINRWDVDPNGTVLGVIQTAPDGGQEIYLPRRKIVYLLDDTLTDSPEGMGWFRHLIDPSVRIKELLRLESLGFSRDLSGIPIGRAPLAAIEKQVVEGKMTRADADDLTKGIRDFITLGSKQPDTGIMIDSQPFTGKTADGTAVSTALQWGIDLLTSEAGSIEQLGNAIRREAFDMALIMGTESLLVGREGAGSLALSQDKTQNLWLNVNSVLADMAEVYDRDLVDVVWTLNGLPPELKPTLKTEDASFKDAEQIARTLRDMATAGAIMAPDDPAIDDVRDLLGVQRQPPMTPEMLGLLRGDPPPEDDPPKEPKDPKETK